MTLSEFAIDYEHIAELAGPERGGPAIPECLLVKPQLPQLRRLRDERRL
jgi:hypothetical protein